MFALHWEALWVIGMGLIFLASVRSLDERWERLDIAGESMRRVWRLTARIVGVIAVVAGLRALFTG